MKQLDAKLLKATLDKHVSEDVDAGRVLGAAVAVTQCGRTVYQNCFGMTTLNGNVPVNNKTVFRLASMTKPITAVAALILVDRGLLSLDDPISKYLPEFADMEIARLDESGQPVIIGRAKTPITPRHILSHTSGIGCGDLYSSFYYNGMSRTDMETLASSAAYHSHIPLSFEPFTEAQYSATAAFDVLARIIELISGGSYEEFLKKEIFEPCNMVDTTFSPSPEQWSRMIALHDYVEGKSVMGKTVDGCVFTNYPTSHMAAGAGLSSTLDDYLNFASLLLAGGVFEGRRILSLERIEEMSTPQAPFYHRSGMSLWGLGVRVIDKEEYTYLPVGSFGWSGAYGTHFWIDPVNRITAVYLKNSCYDGGSGSKTGKQFEIDVFHALTEKE